MNKTNADFSERLLDWYDKHGRKNLPWQIPDPYCVWVSEIMLQQTQVSTVIPYYLRFMSRFPDLRSLSEAPLDAVLSHWSGLGYYARARNLHRTAQQIIEHHQGIFPRDIDTLVSLPGIGRSTAGAILAFSFGQRHSILDGNVKRILCRHEALPLVPNSKQAHDILWEYAEQYTPQNRIQAYTQAIMDLGATVCTRSQPKCTLCPLQSSCQALARDQIQDFPLKQKRAPKPEKTRFFLILSSPEGILLYQRPTRGIWGGLFSLPEWEAPSEAEALIQSLPEVIRHARLETLVTRQHEFTHYRLILKPVFCQLPHTLDSQTLPWPKASWFSPDTWHGLGLPAPIKRLLLDTATRGMLCHDWSIA